MERVKIVVRAPLSGLSGYAFLSRAIVRGLAVDPQVELVALQPIAWEPFAYLPNFDQFMSLIGTAVRNPQECVLLQISLPTEYPRSDEKWRCRVGYTMLETDRLSPAWVQQCNTMDLIVVPSRFNVETFQRSGVAVPVVAVNPGVDSAELFSQEEIRQIPFWRTLHKFKHPEERGQPPRFVFYAAGQWSPPQGRSRKGFEELLAAYFQLYNRTDPVGLMLRTTSTGGAHVGDRALVLSKIQAACQRVGRTEEECAPIVLLHGHLSEIECEAAWEIADAFVLPTHGEGWGLDFARAAAKGIPIATVKYGGVVDFLEGSAGVHWIPHIMEQVPAEITYYSRGSIGGQHRWAVTEVADVRNALQYLVSCSASLRKAALEWAKHLASSFTWERSTAHLVDAIREVVTRPSPTKDASADLVVQPISLGDVFLVSAVVDGMKKKNPERSIDVLTKPSCQLIWEGNPNIRKVLDYPSPIDAPLWRAPFDLLPNAARMAAEYGNVYTPYHYTQIDFSRVYEWFTTKKHIIEVYAEACGLAPSEIGEPFLATKQPNDVVVKRAHYGKPWAVIHPWTSAPNKRWRHFDRLVRWIHDELAVAVVQIGGPEDPRTDEVDIVCRDLHEAAWFLDRACLFVGVDSVGGHIAAARGVPTVSLFGGTTASFSHPRGAYVEVVEAQPKACGDVFGCHGDICRVGAPCIDTVSVDTVVAAARRVMARKGVQP